jgi:acyl-CoA synthetase (AMP-forming)/AMP-acid ligase II
MLFTSGTTGFPKGVLAAHSQVLRGSDLYFQSIGVREGDRVLCINPLFHAFGYKGALLGSLLRGASVYFEETFDADRALELIETERISVLPAPPTVFSDLIAHPSRHRTDLSSLRAAATGGTMVPPALVRSIGSELGCETITTAYGQTEAPTIVCMTTDDRPEDISEWAGRALPGLEVRVVDDAGRPVATGEPGEILARGFIVMKGYFEDEEATAKTIDADGWLHTGDVGVFRDDGLLKITDRKKDMFIVGGLNVYPAEVEAIMSADPRIAELAIVGTSDERLGEVGAAFVVPAAGERLGPDDVIAIARERVANYKVPRYAEIVTNLPRNAAGKVVKVGLRARAAAMSGAAAESAADDTHSTPRD